MDPDWNTTLHGRQFPPDDIRAYWNIVPDTYHVVWVRVMGLFYVRLLDGDKVYEQEVAPYNVFELQAWVDAVAGLHAKFGNN